MRNRTIRYSVRLDDGLYLVSCSCSTFLTSANRAALLQEEWQEARQLVGLPRGKDGKKIQKHADQGFPGKPSPFLVAAKSIADGLKAKK